MIRLTPIKLLILVLNWKMNFVESAIIIDRENSNLKTCVTKIVEENFNLSRTVIITDNQLDTNIHNFSGIIRIDDTNLDALRQIDEKINHFIISFANTDRLNATLSFLKQTYCFNSRAKYLVTVESLDDVQLISETLWFYRLYKSVLLGHDGEIFEIDLKKSKCGSDIRPAALSWFSCPEDPVYAEELLESYSFNAVLDDFERGYADIFLGLGNNLPYAIFETTGTIYDDNLYWVVPKAQRMPFYKAMIRYFPFSFWMCILLAFFLTCAIFSIIVGKFREENRFKDMTRNILYIYSIGLNVAIPKLPKNFTLRVLVLIYCYISLLTCTILQGSLYDILKNPLYDNDITNLDKLLESGLPMKFTDGLSVLFIYNGAQNRRVFDKYIGMNVLLVECLDLLISEKNFATVVDTGALIMRPNIRQSVNIFDIAYFQTVFYMRKCHELFNVFDRELKHIVESGFVDKFVSDMRWKCFLKYKTDYDHGALQFSLEHFQGGFMVLNRPTGIKKNNIQTNFR
ncbi:hypothetical protein TcasGA2_TC002634 [Tribolium castaneum]|uniref:Ionotropic glutamate receptor C-terminal domain-containing protein n=1 Tax=Tribolium castaneum TaxID=7070 RepID=D6WF39_TRICA|nr:hypothetical protein TcasGA2_TC002634 [Tribolium castaneum]